MIQAYLERFQVLTAEEIEAVIPLFIPMKLNKADFFIREGERSTRIAFIKSGVFRSYYLSDEGADITYCFRFQNDLMAAYASFITGARSQENIQALTDVELLVISKEEIDRLSAHSVNWIRLLKIIAEQNYLELEHRVFQLQRDTAVQRYISLLTNQPEYVQQIPLQYLSSYLGITQRHLSRIRKGMSF